MELTYGQKWKKMLEHCEMLKDVNYERSRHIGYDSTYWRLRELQNFIDADDWWMVEFIKYYDSFNDYYQESWKQATEIFMQTFANVENFYFIDWRINEVIEKLHDVFSNEFILFLLNKMERNEDTNRFEL